MKKNIKNLNINKVLTSIKATVLAGAFAGTMTACQQINEEVVIPEITTTTGTETTMPETTIQEKMDTITETTMEETTVATTMPETTVETTQATTTQAAAQRVDDDLLLDDDEVLLDDGDTIDEATVMKTSSYSYSKSYKKTVKKYTKDTYGNIIKTEIITYDENGNIIDSQVIDNSTNQIVTNKQETNTIVSEGGKFSTTEISLSQFEQLTDNLYNELIAKHVVSESGKYFTKKDLYAHVYINNIDFIPETTKYQLINNGYISASTEANFVSKFSVDDAIHGHNSSVLLMNTDMSEVFFGFDHLGPDTEAAAIDDDTIYYTEEYNYNPTALQVNRVINRLHRDFNIDVKNPTEEDIMRYYHEYDKYLASHKSFKAYQYFLGTDNGEEVMNKFYKSTGITYENIKNVELVDLSVEMFDKDSRKEVKDAYNILVSSVDPYQTPKALQNFSNRCTGDDHQTNLTDFGAGEFQAMDMYFIEFYIFINENPYRSFEAVTEYQAENEFYNRYFFFYSNRSRRNTMNDVAHDISDAYKEHETCFANGYSYTLDIKSRTR